jgi:hypothetical protein
MNLAEQLAQAALQARGYIEEQAVSDRERLAAVRAELSRAETMSLDHDLLEQQGLDLSMQTAALRDEIEALEAEHEGLRGTLLERLAAARERLADAYRQTLEEHSSLYYTRELDSVLDAFATELKASGFDPQKASPAQRRQRVSTLEPQARKNRQAALRRAELVSSDLSAQSGLVARRAELEGREQRVEEATRAVLEALHAHSQAGGLLPIVESILAADAGVLGRLHREVLEPMLNDARLERLQGLGEDTDPLQPFRDQNGSR